MQKRLELLFKCCCLSTCSNQILHYDSSFDSLERNDIVWIETPLNPTSQIYDIKKLSDMAHKQKAVVVVDRYDHNISPFTTDDLSSLMNSTFASPVLQRPLDHGADVGMFHCIATHLSHTASHPTLVLHSTTKFMGGHSDLLGMSVYIFYHVFLLPLYPFRWSACLEESRDYTASNAESNDK